MVFYNSCNITDEVYRGWVSGRGWVGNQRRAKPSTGDKQQCCVFGRAQKRPPVNLVGRDSHQQQFDTPSSLISAHQWPHRLCSRLSWFYRVGKRLPVKADLAIYSNVVMSGQWENVATVLNIKLDFYCCDDLVGFCKSSHILLYARLHCTYRITGYFP